MQFGLRAPKWLVSILYAPTLFTIPCTYHHMICDRTLSSFDCKFWTFERCLAELSSNLQYCRSAAAGCHSCRFSAVAKQFVQVVAMFMMSQSCSKQIRYYWSALPWEAWRSLQSLHAPLSRWCWPHLSNEIMLLRWINTGQQGQLQSTVVCQQQTKLRQVHKQVDTSGVLR